MSISVLPRQTALADLLREPSGTWTARLRVDEDHGFFFDHVLDHVPGMLLYEGMVQLAERAVTEGRSDTAPLRVTAADLRMDRLCETDRPAHIEALACSRRRVDVRIRQGDAVLTAGRIALAPATGPEVLHPVVDAPAAAALVHKHDPDNILVGPLRDDGSGYRADILGTSDRYGASVHPATMLLEAARQFAMMSLHVHSHVPLDHQFLLTAVRVAVPAAIPPADEPVHLWSDYRSQSTRRYGFVAEVRTARRGLGTVALPATVLPKDVYARLRASGRI